MRVLIDSQTRRVQSAWNDGEEPQRVETGFEFVTVPGDVRTFVWPHAGTRGHSGLDVANNVIFVPPAERKTDVLVEILRGRALLAFTSEENARLDAANG